MKKTRIIAMLLALSLVISCMTVMASAEPIAIEYAGQKATLALGDWTGVIQSNPQNTSSVASGSGYLAVETTAYPQGVAITTTDSAYTLDSTKAYTMEIKMRTAAADTSYYRAYCGAGSHTAFSGNQEIKPADYADSGSGFPVAAGDWVVKTGDLRNVADGQLAIKIHGGSVGTEYGDSFDIDYIKITEKDSGAVFFYEDFEDTDTVCDYAAINNAVSVAVKGISMMNGGYLVISDRTTRLQGANYTFDYTFKAGVSYTVSFDMKLDGDNQEERFRFYLHNGTSESAPEIVRLDPGAVTKDGTNVKIIFTPSADTSGKAFLKFHSCNYDPALAAAFGNISIDNFTVTPSTVSAETPIYKCSFDSAADFNGWNLQGSGHKIAPVGVPSYVAGNGYVHVYNRKAGVSGAEYISGTNLEAGKAYTLKLRMRISNPEDTLRIMGFTDAKKDFDNSKAFTTDWSDWTIPFTATNSAPLKIQIHSADYENGLAQFDIDSLVVTDSTGAAVINETYDDNVGNWTAFLNSSQYASNPGAEVSHETEDDYATTITNTATYVPADTLALCEGKYIVSGTFKVPFDRSRLVVARDAKTTGASLIEDADYNKINVMVEIEDDEGNVYYAEERKAVTSEWANVIFNVEIPKSIIVKEIRFVGKDGVAPVAGTYDYGAEKVSVGPLNTTIDNDTTDDALTGYPTLVQIANDDGSYKKDYAANSAAFNAIASEVLAAADIPFMFCNAEIVASEIVRPVNESGAVGILAVLLLKRKAAAANDNVDDNVGEDVVEEVKEHYIHVETTAYPQGVEFVTDDPACVLDAKKEYVLEIKIRAVGGVSSYYRAYCAGGAPSTFSGAYEIKPEGLYVNSGFLVEGGDWVVVTGAVKAGAEGQLGIKIHGGAVGGATYGDSFDVDYVKVYEKLTENVIFFEDFEDDETECICNAINGAVGAAIKNGSND